MKKKRVYIASPYTNGDVAVNVRRQLETAHKIMDLGHIPVVPLFCHFQHMLFPRPYKDWLALGLEQVRSCDVVLRLDGHSPGADTETAFANELGIPVVCSIDEIK